MLDHKNGPVLGNVHSAASLAFLEIATLLRCLIGGETAGEEGTAAQRNGFRGHPGSCGFEDEIESRGREVNVCKR